MRPHLYSPCPALIAAIIAVMLSHAPIASAHPGHEDANEAPAQQPPPDYGYELNIPPDQLPPPLSERPTEVTQVEEQAPPARDYGWLNFAPSVALGASFSFTDSEIDKPGMSLWFGASYYPSPSKISPYLGVGLQIEAYYELERYPLDYIPTLKFGGAWLKGNPGSLYNQTFAYMHVYGLVGWRASIWDERHGAYRAGLGISSPVMSPAAAMMLLYGVPVPTQLELIVDTRQASAVSAGGRDWWLQLAIGF